MKIIYIGSFLRISFEGFQFVRGVAQDVPEAVADKLLEAKIADQNVFSLAE